MSMADRKVWGKSDAIEGLQHLDVHHVLLYLVFATINLTSHAPNNYDHRWRVSHGELGNRTEISRMHVEQFSSTNNPSYHKQE